jgi:hypothetical protein
MMMFPLPLSHYRIRTIATCAEAKNGYVKMMISLLGALGRSENEKYNIGPA